jgi:hypothetical protein
MEKKKHAVHCMALHKKIMVFVCMRIAWCGFEAPDINIQSVCGPLKEYALHLQPKARDIKATACSALYGLAEDNLLPRLQGM